ncbi:MAG: hypothetical protein K6F84_07350 [Lachnospiraceae bacterium]|nr:hypothetical protein [Lachnospiraceae bacterium]
MEIVAGIDGGGTKTTVLIWDVSGKFVATRVYGPFNLNSIGAARMSSLLNDIFKMLAEYGECRTLCIGAAGVSNPNVTNLIAKEAEKNNFTGKIVLRGDHEVALYGAMQGKPGAILICGTGSICYGENKKGENIRVGGWGHLIDDVGSGYAIGREALSALVYSYDGRIGPTKLTQAVFDRMGVENINDLVAVIYGNPDKKRIASLSLCVEQMAQENDATAIALLDKAAEDLFGMIKAMYDKLGLNDLDLAFLGGNLTEGSVLERKLTAIINERIPSITIVKPKMNAAEGATLIAYHMNSNN